MTYKTTCPKCNAETEVSGSLVGRFVTCDHCRCLYYVVVPPLNDETQEKYVSVPATSSARPSAPTSLKQTFDARYNRLLTLLVANLVLGAAVLVVELIRLFK
jgi:hypothetical protein